MSTQLRILVDNPDDLLNAGAYDANAVIRVQSSATEAGAYADLAGAGATPTIPIVAGTRAYTAFDPAGDATTWYRTRYENAGATRVSVWSPAFQAGADRSLCTIDAVKARLDISDAPDDAVLLEIIDQVSDEIEAYVGRALHPEDGATYVVDTEQGHTIALPRGIRAVTTLEIAATDQPDTGGTYLAVDAADFVLRPGLLYRRDGWPATEIVLLGGPIDDRIPLRSAINGARIVGDFGFSPVLPLVARIAVQASVAEFLDRRQAGKAGAEGIDLPGLLNASQLAALARLRVGVGIGIA